MEIIMIIFMLFVMFFVFSCVIEKVNKKQSILEKYQPGVLKNNSEFFKSIEKQQLKYRLFYLSESLENKKVEGVYHKKSYLKFKVESYKEKQLEDKDYLYIDKDTLKIVKVEAGGL